MTEHPGQAFTRASEVLEHAIGFLEQIQTQLVAAQAVDASERVQLLLASYVDEQRRLRDALVQYAQDAPARVLDTFTSFAVALPGDLTGPAQPLSTLGVTQWLVGLNQRLITLFRELTDAAPAGEVHDAFAALANQVETHDRRLVKEYQRFEDI